MISKMYAYNKFSKSAKNLAKALGIKRLKHTNSKWRPRNDSVVLNWGSSTVPVQLDNTVLINGTDAVVRASNKLTSLQMFEIHEVPCPEFTTSPVRAREWAESSVIICRTLLRANSGRGIVVAERPEEIVPAPLYTKYFNRKDEYRVHVVRGQVIDVQRKMRKHEVPDEEVNWRVRNYCNGFIFGRGDVAAPASVLSAAVSAVKALDLDFGAVDVGYNGYLDQACVFEVNTAPNLEGTTLQRYVDALR